MTAAPRQLDLLAGKRQRGRKPRGPSEFEIHCAVADYLDRWLMPHWVWFHPANGEQRTLFAGERLKRMGVKRGVSDIALMAPPHGRAHFLELKAQGEEPSHDQWVFAKRLREAGGLWAWEDSVDGALAVLKAWGALPARLEKDDGQWILRRA